MIKWQILEGIAGGARGVGFWGVCPIDARDLKAIREAVATVLPVEDVLVTGSPTDDLTAVSNRVFVKGIRAEQGIVVLVSEYSRESKDDRIRCPVTGSMDVYHLPDMRKQATITPEDPVFDVRLEHERAKLFFVREAR